jgi:hypothetical protein
MYHLLSCLDFPYPVDHDITTGGLMPGLPKVQYLVYCSLGDYHPWVVSLWLYVQVRLALRSGGIQYHIRSGKKRGRGKSPRNTEGSKALGQEKKNALTISSAFAPHQEERTVRKM